jgi:hypothetical protein
MAKALARSRKAGHQVPWTFPERPARKPSAAKLIADTTPQDWAEAWKAEAPAFGTQDLSRPRLRILSAPSEDSVLPWLRVLSEASPAPVAVSFTVVASRNDCQVLWPLRLGFLPGNSAETLIANARAYWPANEQSQSIALGREQAHCDILVHSGTTRTLLKQLLDLPSKIRANVVWLRGGESGDWGQVSSRLTAILAETRAGGYVLTPDAMPDPDFSNALNTFVTELSHAKPLDAAISLAYASSPWGSNRVDLITGLSAELAEFRLPKLAETLNHRMKRMPKGSELDLSKLGVNDQWLTRGVRGGGRLGGEPKDVASAEDQRVAARTVSIEPGELDFLHESEGAEVIATVAQAVEDAAVPGKAHLKRAARFLQQQSFVRIAGEFQPAIHGFVADMPALVRVRIGPPEGPWNSLPAEFPIEKLPQHLERWTLTVWLSEPDHLPRPLKGRIRLPSDGASTECEFRFRPRSFPAFDGRITVLHRGRVIQTAVLRGSVLSEATDDANGDAPSLQNLIQVRQGLGDLRQRRQFDLAFVINHGASGRPLSVALSEDHAWISDLQKCGPIARDINARLSPVAKSVADYADGLEGENGRALLVQLAQLGRYLHLYLVDEQLAATDNRPEIARKEYLQIVSTRSDAVIPFEFIYEFETPDDDAPLCEHWKQGLTTGCRAECDRDSGRLVCPMGFWGIQKVIERHALTPELAREGFELYLQSEPNRRSDTLSLGGIGVFGASKRVPLANLDPLSKALNKYTGVAAGHAADWDTWATLVRDNHPHLLLALAHTDGSGANVSLEIGGKTIKSIQIKRDHVRPDAANQKPLVALLGCDTAGTADDYGQHVAIFRARGAAIVIGTIATVFGEHAALVGKILVEGLFADNGSTPRRLGETLRAMKRQALLDNFLMPLCLVAYGDADWKLTK